MREETKESVKACTARRCVAAHRVCALTQTHSTLVVEHHLDTCTASCSCMPQSVISVNSCQPISSCSDTSTNKHTQWCSNDLVTRRRSRSLTFKRATNTASALYESLVLLMTRSSACRSASSATLDTHTLTVCCSRRFGCQHQRCRRRCCYRHLPPLAPALAQCRSINRLQRQAQASRTVCRRLGRRVRIATFEHTRARVSIQTRAAADSIVILHHRY